MATKKKPRQRKPKRTCIDPTLVDSDDEGGEVKVTVSYANVQKLKNMGFAGEEAMAALKDSQNNLADAIDFLLNRVAQDNDQSYQPQVQAQPKPIHRLNAQRGDVRATENKPKHYNKSWGGTRTASRTVPRRRGPTAPNLPKPKLNSKILDLVNDTTDNNGTIDTPMEDVKKETPTTPPSTLRTRNGTIIRRNTQVIKKVSSSSNDKEEVDESEPVVVLDKKKPAPKKWQDRKIAGLITKCEELSERVSETLNTDGTSTTKPEIMADMLVLKGYQAEGLNWMYTLSKAGLNGILADEMGLGKTVQTISLFAKLKMEGEKPPHLVVVPSSTLAQWHNELTRWCSDLRIHVYHGAQEQRISHQRLLLKHPYRYDVILTTYEMSFPKVDRNFLLKMKFCFLVLDEAQNIKNKSSLRFQALSMMNSQHRLLLTGTPLQNNLEELWNLLKFLMPQLFDSVPEFKKLFKEYIRNKKAKSSTKDTYVERMKKILSPFILRRLKSQVNLNLKPKIECVIRCKMTDHQSEFYKRLYMHSRQVWEKNTTDVNTKKVSINQFLNNILMQLRKTSNHPILVRSFYSDEMVDKIVQTLKENDPKYAEDPIADLTKEFQGYSDFELARFCTPHYMQKFALKRETMLYSSGKFQKLAALLPKLKSEGHRVLIFSQMTRLLDILELLFEDLDFPYQRLDGQTPVGERQGLIDKFNKDKSIFAFLLSTRAGGLGINLATADVVIFYDTSFNPQVDRQAEDRAHRLGQTKQVYVYRLLTEGSCEEHIFEMAQEKKKLNDLLLEEGEYTNFVPDVPVEKQEKDVDKVLTNVFTGDSTKKPDGDNDAGEEDNDDNEDVVEDAEENNSDTPPSVSVDDQQNEKPKQQSPDAINKSSNVAIAPDTTTEKSDVEVPNILDLLDD